MTFFIVLLAMILDPIRLVLTVIVGLLVRAWWQVAVAALVVTVLMQVLSSSMGMSINPIISLIATALILSLTFSLKGVFMKPRPKAIEDQAQ